MAVKRFTRSFSTRTFVCSGIVAGLALAVTSPCHADTRARGPIVLAQQNILVTPGQESMQPEQAQIMQRNQQQEAADAAKSQPILEAAPVYPEGSEYEAPIVEENTGVYGDAADRRQQRLERPQERQLEVERKGQREMDLDMPDGPGQKY